jgi:hypothetical protein
VIFWKENGMANQITGHLDQDRIIEAILDRSGLDSGVRRHLVECPECRAEKLALESRLAQFGELARENAPLPLKSPRLILDKSRAARPDWRLRPAFGMGLVLASLLVFLLNPYLLMPKKDATLQKIYTEMLQDEKFMAEIDKLTDDPLPRFYADMADFPDQDAPEELMENKLPGGQDDRSST